MSQKAPWLVLAGLILIAAALFLLLRTDAGAAPDAGTRLDEVRTSQDTEPMVAEGGAEAPAAGTGTPVERRQVETPGAETATRIEVQGRLVDAVGAPLAGLPVELAQRRLEGGPLRETTSGPDGRFSYRIAAGQGGFVRLSDDERVLSEGMVTFSGSAADIDLGELQVVAASVVSGIVVDPGGQPVAGIQVMAGLGRIMGIGDVTRLLATTDDDGEFRIGGLRAGDYTLRTASPDFLPGVQQIAVQAGERREDLVFRLQRGQAIAGQVVDDLGRPVPGINVGSRRRSSPAAGVTMERFTPGEATVTDDNGLFTLAGLEGDHATVRAWGEGYGDVTEAEVAIGTSNLVLQVERLAVITGTLVDDMGEPIAGSRVRASASRRGNTGLPMELITAEGRVTGGGVATTGEDGGFRIEGVRPGSLTVRATGDGHRPAERIGVAAAPGELVEGVRLIAARGATLVVAVVDSAGEPVPDAEVRVTAVNRRSPEGGMAEAGPRRVVSRDVRIRERDGERVVVSEGAEEVFGRGRTDAEGIATIGGLRQGAALVKASHTELITAQPTEVRLPARGTVDARLAMALGGFAALQTRDAAGQPLAGARYLVRGPASQPDPEDHPGRSDSVGTARVGPLAPGTYSATLQMQPAGRSVGPGIFVSVGGGRTLDGSRVAFEVRAGETTEVQVMKPVLTTFVGSVFDAGGPVAGATVRLRRKDDEGGGMPGVDIGGGTFQATTGSDGSFELEDLSAGTYTVTYGRPDQVVKAQTEVEFAPGQPEARADLRLSGGTLRITVMSRDRGGPLEGAEVEVVTSGEEGEERREVYMMAIRAEPGGAGETMTMQMGGSRVVTDADGLAVIEAVPPGEYSLRIRHDLHVEQVVSGQVVRDGAVTDAGIASLSLGGTVAGSVIQRGAQVMIALVEYRLAEGGEPEQVTAREGKFRIEGLKPGKYKLRARDLLLSNSGSTSRWSSEVGVEVSAGQVETIDLELPTAH